MGNVSSWYACLEVLELDMLSLGVTGFYCMSFIEKEIIKIAMLSENWLAGGRQALFSENKPQKHCLCQRRAGKLSRLGLPPPTAPA